MPKAHRADSADRADSAGRADIAANAENLGGRAPAEFAKASQFVSTYTKADRGQTVTIFERGPFKVLLNCVAGLGSGNVPLAGARLEIVSSVDSRTSIHPSGLDTAVPAGTVLTKSTFETGLANAGQYMFRGTGGYVDTADGVTLDVSSRLRVNGLGVNWCHAVTQATLGGT